MKIGLVQHNPVTGDFPRNVRNLINGYRECIDNEAEIVFSPSLALPGILCGDLKNRTRFALQCEEALKYMAKEVGSVPFGVGTLIPFEDGSWEDGYALLKDGEIIEIVPFGTESTREPALFEIEGLGVLLLPEGADCPLETNADLVLCTNASPWYLNREVDIHMVQEERAIALSVPLAYCAPVGGNGHALLPGMSFVLSSSGDVLRRLPCFEEATLVFDLQSNEPGEIFLFPGEDEAMYKALTLALKDYCAKSGITSVCLGLSGGIDSALTAALAVEALGAENVSGITMPSPYSSQGSVDDSLALAENLGIPCKNISITPAFDVVKDMLSSIFHGTTEDVTEENMQSRLRGILLMAFSNKFGHMLLSTGNKSEAAVGYCTLYGDTCGGMALIGDLYKEQVYSLSRYINREQEIIPWNTIEKEPSAELRHDQRDQDTLPPYETLDAILKLLVEEEISATDVIEEYEYDEDTVRWIQRRLTLNEWKRHQMSIIPQISRKAFGDGRVLPLVQNFRD